MVDEWGMKMNGDKISFIHLNGDEWGRTISWLYSFSPIHPHSGEWKKSNPLSFSFHIHPPCPVY